MLRPTYILIIAFCLCMLIAVLSLRQDFQSSPDTSGLSVSDILQSDNDEDFTRALEPREFSFPEDFGAHNDFRTEWWYFTGNLDDDTSRSFGYQLTFFRFRPTAMDTPGESAWRSQQLYMAHFALSDIESNQQYAFERFSRAALGLAGASSHQYHVWLDNWSAKSEQASGFPLQLQAEQQDIAIDFILERGKPMVLQGDRGLSKKNSQPGGASYYYSFTRMPTTGTVTVNNQRFEVKGLSWMDREWSTSVLSAEQLGWDWFALQLSDGYELMLYQFRRKNGENDPHNYGIVIPAQGQPQTLAHDMFHIQVKDTWSSPLDGSRYPAMWQIDVPEHKLSLQVKPAMANQELDLSFRYWEGSVVVSGKHAASSVSGRGYVELTGYANRGLR